MGSKSITNDKFRSIVFLAVTSITLFTTLSRFKNDRLGLLAQISDELVQERDIGGELGPFHISLNDFYMLPLTTGEGNRLKVVVSYNIYDPSLIGKRIKAVMGVYSSNGSLVKISSFPDGFVANNTEGTTQLATTLDENLKNVTAIITYTDVNKTQKISQAINLNAALESILPVKLHDDVVTNSLSAPTSLSESFIDGEQQLQQQSSVSSSAAGVTELVSNDNDSVPDEDDSDNDDDDN